MKRLVQLGGAGVVGAVLAFFLDKDLGRRRRHVAVDRTLGFARRRIRGLVRAARGVSAEAYGLRQKVTHLREEPKPQPDDATLARKVETKIFRPARVPKGKINVNVERGVVYLRGEADTPEMIRELVAEARKVQGVRDVESRLHLPNAPVPASNGPRRH